MARVTIRWTRFALAGLDAQADYVARENPTVARELVARVFGLVDSLAELPGLGRPGRVPDTRELVVNGTPYVVIYRERPGTVEVLRVLHNAQRWLPRDSEKQHIYQP